MRLSDALMTGRHTIAEPTMGDWDRCAIPMALNAVGKNKSKGNQKGNTLMLLWPWLTQKSFRCPWCPATLRGSSIVHHTFDMHVMEGNKITFEQMVDWIRSIEPRDEPVAEPTTSYKDLETKVGELLLERTTK